MVNEEWRLIINDKMRQNQYEISSLGRIRNIKTGNILKPFISNNGYARISVNDPRTPKKKNINLSIHRLVAEAFLPNTYNKPEVNHINGNKLDNSVGNLEWITYSDNRQHAYDTFLDPRGDERPNAKLTNGEVHTISQLLGEGYRISDIIVYMRTSGTMLSEHELHSIISDIIRGRSWSFIYKQYDGFEGDRKTLLKRRIYSLYMSGYTKPKDILHILTTDFKYMSLTKNYIKDTLHEYTGSTTIESEIEWYYIHI